MDSKELENLSLEIAQLRRAVRKANPFLRSVLELKNFAIISLPFGFLVIAFCLVSRFVFLGCGRDGGFPDWWATLSWILFALFILAGAIVKWVAVTRRAAETQSGATFWTVFKAIYDGGWINLNLALSLCMVVSIVMAIHVGHPWYIVPTLAVFLGLVCNSVAQTADSSEYLWTGWYCIATGCAALFFVEKEPYLWTALVWGGIFLVYGVSGLVAARDRREKER
jgi:hypothetical protein